MGIPLGVFTLDVFDSKFGMGFFSSIAYKAAYIGLQVGI